MADQNSVILIACYEMGHQPLSLAWPKAVLEESGIAATLIDLSIQELNPHTVKDAKFIGIAVPMHTALRIGVKTAKHIRSLNQQAHISFYGLYASLNANYLLDGIANSVIGGEYEYSLAELIQAILNNKSPEKLNGVHTKTSLAVPILDRLKLPIPARNTLPVIDDYAHYTHNGTHVPSGYTESTRGCLHTCKHCPIVPVYQGRFFVINEDVVLADIRQQVAMGAQHITFGDPDFLNAPKHAMNITKQLATEFPDVTFGFTAKVEHIIEFADLIPKFSEYGCTVIVSAFEAIHDHILERLAKGHTAKEMETAIAILTDANIAPQPTWMPFTPWTSLKDYIELLEWIKAQNLIPYIPIVQLAIRMLVPPGSSLLTHPDVDEWRKGLDQENFTYRWDHADPRMDRLQQEILEIAENWGDADPYWAFIQVEQAAHRINNSLAPQWQIPPDAISVPKLTENWFC